MQSTGAYHVYYNIVNKICPDYLKHHTTYTSEICNRDTRSNSSVQLYIAKPNCEFFRKSIMYTGNVICNSLPLNVNNASSVNSFK